MNANLPEHKIALLYREYHSLLCQCSLTVQVNTDPRFISLSLCKAIEGWLFYHA